MLRPYSSTSGLAHSIAGADNSIGAMLKSPASKLLRNRCFWISVNITVVYAVIRFPSTAANDEAQKKAQKSLLSRDTPQGIPHTPRVPH